MKKIIEVTSRNIDRNQFPNPAKFDVQLALSGQSSKSEFSLDGVYNGVMNFPPPNQSFPTRYSPYGYMYQALMNGGASFNDTTFGILPITSSTDGTFNTFTPVQDYVGKFIELIDDTASSTTTSYGEYRKIVEASVGEQQYIVETVSGTDITPNAITLNATFCDLDNILNGFEIEFTTTTDGNLLGVKRTIAYYRGYDGRIYFDEPITEATITSGDTVTISIPLYKIRVAQPFSITPGQLGSNCLISDNTRFRIRDGTPVSSGTISSATATTVTLPASVGTIDYTGYLLWIKTNPVVLSGQLTGGGTVVSGGDQIQGTFTVNTGSGFADDYFKGMTINITSGNFAGHSYTISDWDNATQTGTVTPGWTSLAAGTTNPVATDTFTITVPYPDQYAYIKTYNTATRVATISYPTYTLWNGTKVRYTLTNTDKFDLLAFSYDNHNSLNVTESVMGQQQMVCYSAELINLSLPNVELKTGGKITDYPYVYVQFKSQHNGTVEIYSNNPISKQVLFRTPVMNLNYHPEEDKFINFLGNNMIQEVKFKINDSFSFAVYLPDGQLFEPIESDYFSPSSPNRDVQVSAIFSFTKMC